MDLHTAGQVAVWTALHTSLRCERSALTWSSASTHHEILVIKLPLNGQDQSVRDWWSPNERLSTANRCTKACFEQGACRILTLAVSCNAPAEEHPDVVLGNGCQFNRTVTSQHSPSQFSFTVAHRTLCSVCCVSRLISQSRVLTSCATIVPWFWDRLVTRCWSTPLPISDEDFSKPLSMPDWPIDLTVKRSRLCGSNALHLTRATLGSWTGLSSSGSRPSILHASSRSTWHQAQIQWHGSLSRYACLDRDEMLDHRYLPVYGNQDLSNAMNRAQRLFFEPVLHICMEVDLMTREHPHVSLPDRDMSVLT